MKQVELSDKEKEELMKAYKKIEKGITDEIMIKNENEKEKSFIKGVFTGGLCFLAGYVIGSLIFNK